ncbi:unnamed protein product [Paramecium octaurelia]|uniref:Tetratricopeptide repeat protein n=1 Tax=Paramecium octaurelia TaxID=43137 RepID=A0A8S1YI14_PAROT|nr:unnamed protein product [Paramecium octaurelia]
MNQHFHTEVINYYMEGLIYQKMGDKNQALQDYDKVIELNPKNQLPYYQRGVLQSEIGNKDQALIDLILVLHWILIIPMFIIKEVLFQKNLMQTIKHIKITIRRLSWILIIYLLLPIQVIYIIKEWQIFIIQEKFKLFQEIQDRAIQLKIELQKPLSQSNYDQFSINDIKRLFRCLERQIKKKLKPQTEFSKLEKKQQELFELLSTKEDMISLINRWLNHFKWQKEEAKLKRMDDQFIEEDYLNFTKLKVIINYIITILCFNLCIALYKQSQRINKNYHKQIKIIQLKINEKYQKEYMFKFLLLNQRLKQIEKHLTLQLIQSEKKYKIQVRLHRLTNIYKFQNNTNLFELEKELKIAIIELAMQQSKDLQDESNSQLGEFVTKLSTAKYQKEQNVHQKTGIHDALIVIKQLEDRSVSVKE